MGRLMKMAIASAVLIAGTTELSAQGMPQVSPRPFKRMFDKQSSPPMAVPKALRDSFEKRLQDLPSGTRCDIVVVPADPRLDPRMAIAPPDPRRFTLLMVPTERFCRSR